MHILISCGLFILGAVLASFTGVISERVYTGQSWLVGRSRCNSCNRTLTTLDLIPIVSWMLYRGKCRTCKARVPARYALTEAVMGMLFVLSFMWLGLTLRLLVFLITLLVLCFIVLYDLRHTIVPFMSSALLRLLAIVFAALSATSWGNFLAALAVSLVIGLAFFLAYAISRGRAMGRGDAPIAFALSMLVGCPTFSTALSGLLYSFWIGAIIGIGVLVLRRGGPTMGIEVPFVPFLAAGYVLAFFTQTLWNFFPL